jgi:putative transposase
MKAALNALDFPIGRSKTRRLMKEASVHVRYRRKYKVTTNAICAIDLSSDAV